MESESEAEERGRLFWEDIEDDFISRHEEPGTRRKYQYISEAHYTKLKIKLMSDARVAAALGREKRAGQSLMTAVRRRQ